MNEPINFADLFNRPEIEAGISSLKEQIKSFADSAVKELEAVRAKAEQMGASLGSTSSASKGGRDTTREKAADTEKLYGAYQQLQGIIQALTPVMGALTSAEEKQAKVAKLVSVANDQYASTLERIKAQAELARMAVEGTATATADVTAKTKEMTGAAKVLEAQSKALARAERESASSKKQVVRDAQALQDAYATLAPVLEGMDINLMQLLNTDKKYQMAIRQGTIANNALEGSYEQLEAQYKLLMLAVKSLSAEQLKQANVGEMLVAKAYELREAQKAVMQSVGDNTLSVGHYEKAMNGLNISTQQVLREMPTLANSASQFIIAISNNIPIFIDNFKKASSALGGFGKAVGATLKSVFSWQTALLVLLTILPRVVKNIHNKRKAQEEANAATEKAVKYAELIAEAEKNANREIVNNTNKLKFLSYAVNDNTRSWDERLKAASLMKKEWKDEFKNFSAEEIALGKATNEVNALTNALVAQAEAKAYLNEIGELSIKLYGLETERSKALAKQKGEEAKMESLLAQTTAIRQKQQTEGASMSAEEMRVQGTQLLSLNDAIKAQQKEIDKASAEWRKYDSQMQDVENAIDNIRKRIKASDLFEIDRDGKGKEALLEIPSYYNEMLESLARNVKTAAAREIALYDVSYKEQRDKMQEQYDELLKMREKANSKERKKIQEQLAWLSVKMLAEAEVYKKGRQKMMNELLKDYKYEVVEEEDIDAERLKNVKNSVTREKNYRDRLIAMEYSERRTALESREHTAYEEAELKDWLNERLLDSEYQYWKAYLKMLEDEGLQLTDVYVAVAKRLASFANAPSGRTSTHKKRGSRNFRNLTEVAFAMNPVTGERTGAGFFDVKIKDEYLDFANSVNEALQTSMDYMDAWMDKRIEMAEVAVEQAKKETEAARTALDYEREARANGYANNVELARKEYEDRLALEQRAIAEQRRLEKIQERINTAQQISSLLTATANLWSSYTKLGVLGPALAIAATTLMWGSFAAAKITASSLANKTTYGEGMAEYLDYGGSHASGHDIDFGRTKDGRRRSVERGEVIGVINRRNVAKYGAENVLGIIRSLNDGTFEKDYAKATLSSKQLLDGVFGPSESKANSVATGDRLSAILRESLASEHLGMGRLEADYSVAFNGKETDLSAIEEGLRELVSQGSVKVVNTPYGRIEYRGNTKRIIKNS